MSTNYADQARIRLNTKPLAWLPNTEGFEFTAVLQDGSTKPAKVVLRPEGHHTTSIEYTTLKGWL